MITLADILTAPVYGIEPRLTDRFARGRPKWMPPRLERECVVFLPTAFRDGLMLISSPDGDQFVPYRKRCWIRQGTFDQLTTAGVRIVVLSERLQGASEPA